MNPFLTIVRDTLPGYFRFEQRLAEERVGQELIVYFVDTHRVGGYYKVAESYLAPERTMSSQLGQENVITEVVTGMVTQLMSSTFDDLEAFQGLKRSFWKRFLFLFTP